MGYAVVAEISNIIIGRLCEALVPEVILSADSIGMCSPDEHGDFKLGLHLYDLSENEEMVVPGMVNAGMRRQTYPSTFLNLSYMLTAYSNSDIKFRAAEEQKIMGMAVQALRDHSVIEQHLLGDDVTVPARIELLRLEQYEKMRLWNFPNVPYKLSLFFKVSPVELPSAKTKPVTRVTSAEFVLREEK